MTKAEARKINRIRRHAERLAELAETSVGILLCYIDDNEDALMYQQFDSGVGLHNIEDAERTMRKLRNSYQRRVKADEEE